MRSLGLGHHACHTQKFELAGALLAKGQYRSAPAYLEAIKRLHISAGFVDRFARTRCRPRSRSRTRPRQASGATSTGAHRRTGVGDDEQGVRLNVARRTDCHVGGSVRMVDTGDRVVVRHAETRNAARAAPLFCRMWLGHLAVTSIQNRHCSGGKEAFPRMFLPI